PSRWKNHQPSRPGARDGARQDGRKHHKDRRAPRGRSCRSGSGDGTQAFGAARLAGITAKLRSSLVPGQGRRAGRPTNPARVRHPKVPMSAETERRLALLAERASTAERKVSPMQIAAQILEEAVADVTDR